MALLLEELVDESPARIGLGGSRVAACNHHAPDGIGRMGFMFVVSRRFHVGLIGSRSTLTLALTYFHTASGFNFATGFPPLMCSSMMVATSASVTLEYQVASG